MLIFWQSWPLKHTTELGMGENLSSSQVSIPRYRSSNISLKGDVEAESFASAGGVTTLAQDDRTTGL